jgi:hypothetical protein
VSPQNNCGRLNARIIQDNNHRETQGNRCKRKESINIKMGFPCNTNMSESWILCRNGQKQSIFQPLWNNNRFSNPKCVSGDLVNDCNVSKLTLKY